MTLPLGSFPWPILINYIRTATSDANRHHFWWQRSHLQRHKNCALIWRKVVSHTRYKKDNKPFFTLLRWRSHCTVGWIREGLPGSKFPKSRHCLDGGVWPLLGFFWRICPDALRALKGDELIIYHQKVIFPHKSVAYSPEKIILPHLFNIFTLKHD